MARNNTVRRQQTTTAPSPAPVRAQAPAVTTGWWKRFTGDHVNFAIMLATVIAGSSIFYYIGKDAGQAELKIRQDLAALDLPKLSQETRDSTEMMTDATEAFKDLLVNNKTYEAMKKEFDGLETRANLLERDNERLTKELADTSRQLGEANVTIEQLTSVEQNYDLKDGSTVTIFDSLLTVGLIEVSLGGKAQMNFNGVARTATAGDVFDVKATNGKPCTIRVTNVAYIGSTAKFTADCSAAQK